MFFNVWIGKSLTAAFTSNLLGFKSVTRSCLNCLKGKMESISEWLLQKGRPRRPNILGKALALEDQIICLGPVIWKTLERQRHTTSGEAFVTCLSAQETERVLRIAKPFAAFVEPRPLQLTERLANYLWNMMMYSTCWTGKYRKHKISESGQVWAFPLCGCFEDQKLSAIHPDWRWLKNLSMANHGKLTVWRIRSFKCGFFLGAGPRFPTGLCVSSLGSESGSGLNCETREDKWGQKNPSETLTAYIEQHFDSWRIELIEFWWILYNVVKSFWASDSSGASPAPFSRDPGRLSFSGNEACQTNNLKKLSLLSPLMKDCSMMWKKIKVNWKICQTDAPWGRTTLSKLRPLEAADTAPQKLGRSPDPTPPAGLSSADFTNTRRTMSVSKVETQITFGWQANKWKGVIRRCCSVVSLSALVHFGVEFH